MYDTAKSVYIFMQTIHQFVFALAKSAQIFPLYAKYQAVVVQNPTGHFARLFSLSLEDLPDKKKYKKIVFAFDPPRPLKHTDTQENSLVSPDSCFQLKNVTFIEVDCNFMQVYRKLFNEINLSSLQD
jgi:hypothetical protein